MGETKRILLAEDNANDVELALAALAEHDLADEVAVVRDGNEVLDYLYRRGPYSKRSAENPALVVLDIKMPKMGGLEVLGMIKKDESLKLIPVVMLTSSREDGDLMKSYQLGVNAYVVKPLDFLQFSTAVKQLGLFWAVVNEVPPGCMRRV
jgi:CheY-like chemotaxis protein